MLFSFMRIAKIIKLTVFIQLMYCINIFAQQPTSEWIRRFSGPNADGCGSIAMGLDGQGNVYVGGRVTDPFPNANFSLVKYSPSGVQQWAVYYNSHDSAADYLENIAVDTSGNVYLTGYSGYNFGPFEFLTVKYNTNGVFQWARSNGSGLTRSLTIDKQQNIIVTGGGTINQTTIKYTPNGDTLWVRVFNAPPRIAGGLVIRCDDSSNVYIGGTSNEPGSQNDFHIVKYSPSGTQLWWAFYNGPMFNSIDICEDIAIDKTFGNVILTGQSRNGSVTGYDYATVKYNSAGTLQWVKRYDGPISSDDYARSITVDKFGNTYVTGSSNGINVNRDIFTIKYSPIGDTLWTRRYDANNGSYDEGYNIIIDTASSNIYVAGNGNSNITAIKYSPLGVQQWVGTYPGSVYNSKKNNIKLNQFQNVYVCGRNAEVTAIDCITIKYSDPVGINQINSETPEKYSLFQNYPNPFNPTTKIKFSLPRESFTQLKVYDLLGRVTATVVNEKLKAGTYEAGFDASSLASGVYFYSLTAEGFSETKKMILMK